MRHNARISKLGLLSLPGPMLKYIAGLSPPLPLERKDTYDDELKPTRTADMSLLRFVISLCMFGDDERR